MNKIFVLLFVFLSAHSFTIESSYDNAHQKALKEKKVLVVFLREEKSPYCTHELSKIIKNAQLSRLLEEKAVFSIVTQGQYESYPIELLYTQEYPSLFFLDTDELFICKALRGEINTTQISECLTQE